MVDLGTLGGTSSHAYDINDAGFVVGVADRAAGAGGGSWATLWQNDAGNTAVDLDAWLDAINPTLGAYWTLNEARGINNNGLITGQGIYDDGPGGLSDGYRAFVLDASSLVHPIPGRFQPRRHRRRRRLRRLAQDRRHSRRLQHMARQFRRHGRRGSGRGVF